ncbi:unnamed protein product [Spirodela intermedia]|uniref:PB1 domain-containing protein n=1 Tax=Spirodela intermedia TaxID=51605 RepID=A0A7I8LIN3_SPIIN|nr:unnamed protein product [Spirodela intermedia]
MAASHHHLSEQSSGASASPPPPTHRWHHHGGGGDGSGGEEPKVRLMCSFGGRILPRPHDHQLRYVGGETRIVAISRAASFAALLAKLSKLPGGQLPAGGGGGGVRVKYQLPHEDLDALISVSSDEDVEIMMEEYDRLAAAHGGGATAPRLRLFLFPAGGFGSLHDRWFLDALSSGPVAAAVAAPPLERAQSEASSVISELPDYLFGLDGGGGGGAAAAEREGKLLPEEETPPPMQVPVYFVPAQPPGPVPLSLHMSYGPVHMGQAGPIQTGPVYISRFSMSQPGPSGPYGLPVHGATPQGYGLPSSTVSDGVYRGSMRSINRTVGMGFQGGSAGSISWTADP